MGACRASGRVDIYFWVSGVKNAFAKHLRALLTASSLTSSSNKMPAAVRAAVGSALEKYGRMSEEEAKDFVANLEREGKLVEDCWD